MTAGRASARKCSTGRGGRAGGLVDATPSFCGAPGHRWSIPCWFPAVSSVRLSLCRRGDVRPGTTGGSRSPFGRTRRGCVATTGRHDREPGLAVLGAGVAQHEREGRAVRRLTVPEDGERRVRVPACADAEQERHDQSLEEATVHDPAACTGRESDAPISASATTGQGICRGIGFRRFGCRARLGRFAFARLGPTAGRAGWPALWLG
jgi:hypothetical protein